MRYTKLLAVALCSALVGLGSISDASAIELTERIYKPISASGDSMEQLFQKGYLVLNHTRDYLYNDPRPVVRLVTPSAKDKILEIKNYTVHVQKAEWEKSYFGYDSGVRSFLGNVELEYFLHRHILSEENGVVRQKKIFIIVILDTAWLDQEWLVEIMKKSQFKLHIEGRLAGFADVSSGLNLEDEYSLYAPESMEQVEFARISVMPDKINGQEIKYRSDEYGQP